MWCSVNGNGSCRARLLASLYHSDERSCVANQSTLVYPAVLEILRCVARTGQLLTVVQYANPEINPKISNVMPRTACTLEHCLYIKHAL